MYRALGCEVEELFCEVDGHFPNHHPDPAKPANLQDLIRAVQAGAAEVGPKGWAVRPLKRYASWVQNVVRQFGPYLLWALEI